MGMCKTPRHQASANSSVPLLRLLLPICLILVSPQRALSADNCTVVDTNSISDEARCYFQLTLRLGYVYDSSYIENVCTAAVEQLESVSIDDGSTTGLVRCCNAHASTNCSNFQTLFKERMQLIEEQGGQQNFTLGCPVLTMDACDASVGPKGEPRLDAWLDPSLVVIRPPVPTLTPTPAPTLAPTPVPTAAPTAEATATPTPLTVIAEPPDDRLPPVEPPQPTSAPAPAPNPTNPPQGPPPGDGGGNDSPKTEILVGVLTPLGSIIAAVIIFF